MTVNGLQLPASFGEFFEREWCTNWDVKEGVDAYGHPLQIDFEPLDTVERMEESTAELGQYFAPPSPGGQPGEREPEFLFDISDFSKIVQFGRSLGGAPFCFDYGSDIQAPSVILHDDSYGRWRRLAANFDTFISLFERYRREE